MGKGVGLFVISSMRHAGRLYKLGPVRKLVGTFLIGVFVWIGSGLAGFPRAFRWFFLGYVVFGFLFFLLLDARPIRMPNRPVLAVATLFLLAAAALTAAGALLPQYNPQTEMAKIQRLQQAVLERERAKRLQALQALAPEVRPSQPVAEVPQQAQKGQTSETEAKVAKAVPAKVVEVAPEVDERLVARGRQVYDDYECYNCHKIGGKGGVKRRGPELDNVGALLSREMLRKKILDPGVYYAEGFENEFKKGVMPDTFKDTMSEDELKALDAYLSSLRNTTLPTPKPLFPDGRPVPPPATASEKKQTAGGASPVASRPPCKEVPPAYASKHMPDGWWTAPEVIAAGRAIYEGARKPDVVCAACHGRDGRPILTGAKDLRDPALAGRLSDCLWFFKVSEGVPQTPMTAWKEKLTEEEIWKVISYQHTFSHGGTPATHAHQEAAGRR